jgi:tetratricopeptide (TPR) repeat protein
MGRFHSLEFEATPVKSQLEPTEKVMAGEAIRDAEFYLNEAKHLYNRRELEPALRSYSKALEIDPGSADAWNGQINCLIHLEELHEADMWAKKATEIVGETQTLLTLRARIYCRRGDFDRAYGLSDAAMEIPGNSPLTWIVRGEIMLYAKNKQPEYCFDKAVATNKHDYTIYMDIAECCIYAKKYTMAFSYLKVTLNENPDIMILWMLNADCYRLLGNRKKALECLSKVLEIDPTYNTENIYKQIKGASRIKNLFKRLFRMG